MQLHRQAEIGGHRLFAQIVIGGAQAPGGNHNVVVGEGDLQRLLEALGIVPHHRRPVDVDPQFRQPLGDHLGIGVHNVPQQNLGADT